MDNFNSSKCYIEKADNKNSVSACTQVNYLFQIISSFIYLVILIYLFFASKADFSNTLGGNGLRYFLLYALGLPNLKILFNSLFAKNLKLDFGNGLLYINNKPLSIERATSISITEICPYHYSWRWGQTPAFNLSFYHKSVITITTDFGDINFYVCSKKALDLLIKFFEKFNKNYSTYYDEQRLWFTLY